MGEISNADIAELRKLLAEATPGKWVIGFAGVVWCDPDDRAPGDSSVCVGKCSAADAELIAAMHEAFGSLLDEVEAARAFLKEHDPSAYADAYGDEEDEAADE